MKKERKIKVLVITGKMNLGGLENQLMHLLRKADKNAFQIDFTSTIPDAYYRSEIEALGGGYLEIPPMAHRNPVPYCKALYQIMKTGEYDVVHSHELFHSGIVLMIAKLAGVPIRIAHAHNWQDSDGTGKRRSLIRSVYNAVMRQLIVSCSTDQMACSSLAGEFLYGKKATERSSYRVVYNSVDTARFLELYEREETGEFCDGWINVLHVGRVNRVKNQLFLTEVAAELKNRGKKIRILCAGEGDEDYIEQIRYSIEQTNLYDYFQLIGARRDVDVLMRKASVFVLPSQYEGMPLVLIEAQASGLPCVVADTFSHEVDFGIGMVRWLELADGATAWADAIEQAISVSRTEKKLVASAVEEKGFDSAAFTRILCDTYKRGCLREND